MFLAQRRRLDRIAGISTSTQSWIVRPLELDDYARIASPLALSEGSTSSLCSAYTYYVCKYVV